MDEVEGKPEGRAEMTERITAADFNAAQAKQRKPRVDREGPIHLACLHCLQWKLPGAAIHHSANELDLGGDPKAKAIAQGKAKARGMRPGWPDIEVIWRGHFWTFEVKSETGRVSPEQRDCGADIIANGGRWAVVRSVDDVKRCIAAWQADGAIVDAPFAGIVT